MQWQRIALHASLRLLAVEVGKLKHCWYHSDSDITATMTNTTIRRATGADFATLLEIDAASFPDGLAYDAEELFYFMSQPGAETWLLESDGHIAAFMIVDVDRRNRWITLV